MDATIKTQNLQRHYQMGGETIHALRGVDLVIERGEYVAIMGPSGSGKSTLMHMIGCLDTPDDGEYWLNGQLVSDMSDRELARVRNKEVGFVFQTFNLLPRANALHNVELPLIYAGLRRKERLVRAKKALAQVGLAERMDHRPAEMSGGQRQRVAVARALMGLFHELHSAGHTIVVVTHELDIARHARRIIHILDGKVADDSVNPDQIH